MLALRGLPMDQFWFAALATVGFLALMMPLGWLSFRFVEAPFLRLRRPTSDRNRRATAACE